MQRGMTLIELAIVLVLMGLLAGAAGPSVAGLRDRYFVTSMASAVANAHNRARIHAVMTGAATELEVRADSLIVRSMTGSDTTLVWAAPGPASQGITLGGAPRVLQFAPTGVTMGFANATFVLTRGSGHRQVVVSRLGRVRVLP
ncbi:MAG TPA: GspH/FimT family pseudopilin [Gemmatimonadales bacterium]|nr:GspH/FimT family pseudopilin [Gemmatimonadales bacterium]